MVDMKFWKLYDIRITLYSGVFRVADYEFQIGRYLFNVHSFDAPASTSFISSYFSLNDNRRLFVFSDIVLTFKLAYQKHLRSRWHCHRTKVQIQWAVDIATANESTDTVGSGHCHRERKYRYSGHCPLSCDATARLSRSASALQTSRLRILLTDTLNQVTLK